MTIQSKILTFVVCRNDGTCSGHPVKHEHVLPSKPRASSTNRSLACIMIHPRINMNLRVKVQIIRLMKMRMMMVRREKEYYSLLLIILCVMLLTVLLEIIFDDDRR